MESTTRSPVETTNPSSLEITTGLINRDTGSTFSVEISRYFRGITGALAPLFHGYLDISTLKILEIGQEKLKLLHEIVSLNSKMVISFGLEMAISADLTLAISIGL